MDKRKNGSPTELRLMVVGSSGHSQFLLTNAILGREEFPKDITCISGSRKNTGELAGRRVAVINGPNIYDKDMSPPKRKMELRRSKCLCIPGPHAFLVAFDMDKISPNDVKTQRLMKERFGNHCLRHCMVLLASERNPDALFEKLQKTDWHLRELIEKYGGRFHVYSKNWRDRSRDRELLQKIERMVASLGGSYFSSRTFQKAEDCVKKEEKKLRKQRSAEIEKAWTEMEKQYIADELYHQKDAYTASVGAEIRAKAEMDNGWLRTSLVRGLGTGFVVGAVMGALVGSIEGPGGMVLYGIIGGAVGGSAGGTAQVAIKHMEDRVSPPARLNFNSIFINRFFTALCPLSYTTPTHTLVHLSTIVVLKLRTEAEQVVRSDPFVERMASTISLLSEKHFLCSLCRDIFTSPVTIACGHSFCLSCLSHYWARHQSKYCPHCKRVFTDRPDLSVNHILADISDNYRKNRPQQPPDEEMVIDVEQMILERLQKIERLKYSLEVQKGSYLREVRESQKVFSALVYAMEKGHKAVVAAIEDRQRDEEKRVETLVEELEQEIQELKKETTESDHQISVSDDQSDDKKQINLKTISPLDMKDWSKVTLETDPCFGVTRRALSDIMDKMRAEVNKLSKSELKRTEKYTVDVNLSAKTAHPFLSVSDDRKQVRHTDKLQEVPDHPKRFDRVANVLAKESFGSGRCYWEVEVGEKLEWSLGVVKKSINRKGKFTVCPANGFWTLSLRAGGQFVANTSPITPLALEPKPRKVGVFVDYPVGRVSFYCAESGVHIHTFTDTFTDRLHPFFGPGRLHGGKNAAPLIIGSSFCSI
ncbi:E3 ubiquitin-protein ligase TRIM39-like [Hippoglossus hippoglossus]|uniref:E3 ubiquitin-protein ligase TRIM39-like n=1 Tax=Hippoglossus hippoglossus TaxID=8267 RepID=UPI00148DB363|nr:E3 ubiquitin-protein ligase TRIM39-like [Hippoglossus hippoglossus]